VVGVEALLEEAPELDELENEYGWLQRFPVVGYQLKPDFLS